MGLGTGAGKTDREPGPESLVSISQRKPGPWPAAAAKGADQRPGWAGEGSGHSSAQTSMGAMPGGLATWAQCAAMRRPAGQIRSRADSWAKLETSLCPERHQVELRWMPGEKQSSRQREEPVQRLRGCRLQSSSGRKAQGAGRRAGWGRAQGRRWEVRGESTGQAVANVTAGQSSQGKKA